MPESRKPSRTSSKREKPTPEPKAAFEAVQELVNALDGDLDDCITNADLSVLCSKKAIVFTEDEIQEMFTAADFDHSGKVNAAKIVRATSEKVAPVIRMRWVQVLQAFHGERPFLEARPQPVRTTPIKASYEKAASYPPNYVVNRKSHLA